jgi:N-acetylglutamate synthase-like GNAT family acetyltransferase
MSFPTFTDNSKSGISRCPNNLVDCKPLNQPINDSIIEDGYAITIDQKMIDLSLLHHWLKSAYWCKDIPFEIMQKSVENSLTFSLHLPDKKFIGFGRLVTAYATFAYLADVIIDPKERGKNLGTFLVQTISNIEKLKHVRTWILLTKDAQKLYESVGWHYFSDPKTVMRYRQVFSEAKHDFYQRLNNI